ncbi:hypothetical protein ACJJTC_010026 [Scirpophaga incertulas]
MQNTPRVVAATTTPTSTITTQPQDAGRAPYAAIAGGSREFAARDPRLRGRTDDHSEKCFDTEHRLLVKTPEAKHTVTQQRPAKRPQEEDEAINTRATKQKLEGGRGRKNKNIEAAEQDDRPQSAASVARPPATETAAVLTAAPPKPQRLRKPKRFRSTGAEDNKHSEPSEVPVVAASSQRTKAKPATSDRAPLATEGTAAEIIEKLVQIAKAAFVSVMSGESLTTVITRGLMELWGLLSRSWSV